MSVLYIPIRSLDPRLKRNIRHDDRSWLYRLPTAGLSIQDKTWSCYLASVLDQGDVGSCTANAADEMLASDPLYQTLPMATQAQVARGDQVWPLDFYHDETVDDDVEGTYPGEDTGSDALGMGKAALARGDISGYQHTFSADDALKGVSNTGVAGWGTQWKTGMDDVNTTTGQVKYSGQTRGGHELSLFKIVAAKEQVWFHNHWGAWGYQNTGVAWISFDDFEKSLADQGDVVFFTPLTSPAPVPTPTPTPTPSSPLQVDINALSASTAKFRNAAFWGGYAQAKSGLDTFLVQHPASN